jgi:hypothetical protein
MGRVSPAPTPTARQPDHAKRTANMPGARIHVLPTGPCACRGRLVKGGPLCSATLELRRDVGEQVPPDRVVDSREGVAVAVRAGRAAGGAVSPEHQRRNLVGDAVHTQLQADVLHNIERGRQIKVAVRRDVSQRQLGVPARKVLLLVCSDSSGP